MSDDRPANDGLGADDDGQDFPRVGGSTDCFAPPSQPCECYCLHCGRTFMSSEIWFQRVIGDPHLDGFWMCPTPNCDGAGFTFDIFPTDPEHPANAGWVSTDDQGEWDDDGSGLELADSSGSEEWDPSEPDYQPFDVEVEGEEWKRGLPPRAPLPPLDADEQAEAEPDSDDEQSEQERRYEMPDQRPRVLDWTDRPDRSDPPAGGGNFNEDDIPF